MISSINVFQIEDEKAISKLTKILLESSGLKYVGLAETLEEVRIKVNTLIDGNSPIDIVLLDHKFPPDKQEGRAAEEALRYIVEQQAKGALQQLKAILLLSGDAQHHHVEILQKIAPQLIIRLLKKPYDNAELLSTITDMVGTAA